MATTLLAVAAACLPTTLADANFVAGTCKSSDNDQCVAVLGTDPRSAKATTVRELASIGLDIATANAKDSSSFLAREAGKQGGVETGNALRQCVSCYGDAVLALKAAREGFDAGAYGEAEARTGAAEDAGDRCEQAFTDRGLKSIVPDVDRRMKDWTSVASDLIDLLWIVKRSRRLLRA
ncbi:uncharacterized protein LOC133895210 [Phragmites australis]|uniref:uncharacterized protein LOC133895210 n=1 Tax=Phragmites australis TaxID=29695 RepID=UPI002D78A4CC|nr:uncharacterized protein LOC133895210 [Phragmites australis]